MLVTNGGQVNPANDSNLVYPKSIYLTFDRASNTHKHKLVGRMLPGYAVGSVTDYKMAPRVAPVNRANLRSLAGSPPCSTLSHISYLDSKKQNKISLTSGSKT
jgi:hypothetical protein